MKVNCKEDCGNAPLKLLLKDLNIAFGKGDVQSILDKVTDDISWEMVGDKRISGKEDFARALENMKDYTATELTIHHIITHGRAASSNGKFVMKNGERFAFCDVYEFNKSGKSAKIKSITSYAVELK